MKLQQLAVLLDQSTRNHSFQRIAGQNSTASFASYPASMTLVFARWNRRLAHESIPSKLVKKMPTAFDRYRQWHKVSAAFLG